MAEKTVLNIDIDNDLYERAVAEAKKLGIPLSGLVRLAIQNFLGDIRFERKSNDSKEPGTLETDSSSERPGLQEVRSN